MFAGLGQVATTAWWAYTLGPIVGAVLGGAVYQALFAAEGTPWATQ